MAWESQQIGCQDVAQKGSFIYHWKGLFEEILNLVLPTWCGAWLTHKRQPIGLMLIGPKIDLDDLTCFGTSFSRGFRISWSWELILPVAPAIPKMVLEHKEGVG